MESQALVSLSAGPIVPLSAQEVYGQVQRIQQIIDMVMIEGVHYGIIPGTGERSLWKPGAEKIILTFHFVPTVVDLEDLGTGEEVRYRVKSALSDPLGNLLGEGVGECSSFEEKFAWREAICEEEWEAADPGLRRTKYKKGGEEGFFTVLQIRTNRADQLNSVLKRAKKRSLIDAVLTVTAASDCFKQELEEEEGAEQERKKTQPAKQPAQAGKVLDGVFKSATPYSTEPKRPGKATIEHGSQTLDLGFWKTPGELALEKDWTKFAGKPCRFSFESKESKGKIYRNLTYLSFPAPADDNVSHLFPEDRMADEERAAMQQGA